MNTQQSTAWLGEAIKSVRATAAAWGMAGWPTIANAYRRDARALQLKIERLRACATN